MTCQDNECYAGRLCTEKKFHISEKSRTPQSYFLDGFPEYKHPTLSALRTRVMITIKSSSTVLHGTYTLSLIAELKLLPYIFLVIVSRTHSLTFTRLHSDSLTFNHLHLFRASAPNTESHFLLKLQKQIRAHLYLYNFWQRSFIAKSFLQ